MPSGRSVVRKPKGGVRGSATSMERTCRSMACRVGRSAAPCDRMRTTAVLSAATSPGTCTAIQRSIAAASASRNQSRVSPSRCARTRAACRGRAGLPAARRAAGKTPIVVLARPTVVVAAPGEDTRGRPSVPAQQRVVVERRGERPRASSRQPGPAPAVRIAAIVMDRAKRAVTNNLEANAHPGERDARAGAGGPYRCHTSLATRVAKCAPSRISSSGSDIQGSEAQGSKLNG